MSYASMYAVNADGAASETATFGNSFRGFWLIWETLSQRYLGRPQGFDPESMRLVWALAKREDVRWEDRVVMAMTFDRVLIKRENCPELVRCLRDYAVRADDPGHTFAFADEIKALLESDPSVQAVGWNGTSVSESYWSTKYREGENEDGTSWEREEPFDLATDEGHWFLFDELKRTDSEAATQ